MTKISGKGIKALNSDLGLDMGGSARRTNSSTGTRASQISANERMQMKT